MPRTVLDRSDAVLALAGVFRRRGFESGSLSVIQRETGIGRGSLYHFFPNGKADMARAVLTLVRAWFDEQVFEPLRTATDAGQAATAMSQEVHKYFDSRERVCLFAAMTLGEEQEAFAAEVHAYFADWVGVLAETLERGGVAKPNAAGLAVDAVAAIQGGLIMTRALDDDAVFSGIVARVNERLLAALR
jgi:AcrR family transcriptional regulator